MENFNRIVSFVLGLIVVIVFLAIISGRFDLRNQLRRLGGQTTISPTAAIGRQLSPTPTSTTPLDQEKANAYRPVPASPTSIPATGLPSFLVPTVFAAFSLGIYLRKMGKKT